MLRLNKNQMKYIAIIAMLIDHIGMLFIPISTPLGAIMRFIGRLTAPTMSLFIAEGYIHTSDKKKYGIRLFVFAVISQLAYAFMHGYSLARLDFNMIFTLFLAFLSLLCLDRIDNIILKVLLVAMITYVSRLGDWGITAVVWAIMFYLLRDDKNKQAIGFALISGAYFIKTAITYTRMEAAWYSIAVHLGLFLFIPLFYCYNGEGGKKSRFSKWFFYIFYPLHMVILKIIAEYIG